MLIIIFILMNLKNCLFQTKYRFIMLVIILIIYVLLEKIIGESSILRLSKSIVSIAHSFFGNSFFLILRIDHSLSLIWCYFLNRCESSYISISITIIWMNVCSTIVRFWVKNGFNKCKSKSRMVTGSRYRIEILSVNLAIAGLSTNCLFFFIKYLIVVLNRIKCCVLTQII